MAKAEAIARDRALMERLADGDRDAGREVVSRFATPLARFAGGILRDAAEGEDVAQEAILKLWRNAAAWRPDGLITGQLWRIAYNDCMDRLRRRKRHATEIDADAAYRAADDRVNPETSAFGREVGNAVSGAFEKLPDRQRAALLAQLDGRKGEEIAAMLDVSAEAVESLLARARRALRLELSEIYADAGQAGARRARQGR